MTTHRTLFPRLSARLFAHRSTAAAAALFGSLGAYAPAALAEDNVIAPEPGMYGLPDDNQTHWGLGVGVGVQRQPYAGIDTKTRALPLIFFENRYVRVLGLGADLKLPNAGPVSFALRMRYSPEGYEASDAPILGGMEERKGAVLAGGAASWRLPAAYGVLSAEVLHDVSGNSGGTQGKLSYDLPLRLGAFTVTPNVAAVLLDRKTVDYYYGVKANEVRGDRPQYDGKRTLNVELGVRTGYALARNQVVTFDVGVTAFGSGIKDSPLVDRSTQTGVRLGYVYRF